MRSIITKLLSFGSQNTYYLWKRQKRPIIKLLEKYFTKEDIEEFLETGEISKMERIDEFLETEKKYIELVNLFKKLDS